MPMKLCKHCIEALQSHGEHFKVADDSLCSLEDSEEENQPCDFCGEFDELWFCWTI
jgi:hypothetical protein